jgi:hypothetical protein
MFPQNIQCPIRISVDQPTSRGSVESALDALATEFIGLRVICVPCGQGIAVQGGSLAGVRLFLLNHLNPVPFAEAFQLAFEGKNRDLSKLLIVSLAHVDPLLKVRVVTDNNLADAFTTTPVDHIASRLVQKVIDFVITSIKQFCLLVGQPRDALKVFNRLQPGILFVVPLVNRLDPLTVNDEGLLSGADTGGEVVQSEVNAEHIFSWFNLLNLWSLINIDHIEVSRPQPGENANLLHHLVSDPLRDGERHPPVLTPKRPGHRDSENPFFARELYPVARTNRDRQQEVPILGQIGGDLNLDLVAARQLKLQQLKKGLERPVHNLQRLLSDVGGQFLIVFVLLCVVVIALITEVFAFLKKVSAHVVEAHVEHIFAQVAHLFKCVGLLLIQPEAIGLTQIHFQFPLYIHYFSGNLAILPAKLALLSPSALKGEVPRRRDG